MVTISTSGDYLLYRRCFGHLRQLENVTDLEMRGAWLNGR